MTELTRFERYVERTDGCWAWRGAHIPTGYAVLGARGAHRVAYELFVGPIPSGLVIDHLCRNPGCVNPAHLEPVTVRENTLRGVGPSARNVHKTHCPAGHPYDAANTLPHSGRRDCRTCARARKNRWTAQNPTYIAPNRRSRP